MSTSYVIQDSIGYKEQTPFFGEKVHNIRLLPMKLWKKVRKNRFVRFKLHFLGKQNSEY